MVTKCLRCGGRGWVWIEPEKATRCPRCDGTGEVFTEHGAYRDGLGRKNE